MDDLLYHDEEVLKAAERTEHAILRLRKGTAAARGRHFDEKQEAHFIHIELLQRTCNELQNDGIPLMPGFMSRKGSRYWRSPGDLSGMDWARREMAERMLEETILATPSLKPELNRLLDERKTNPDINPVETLRNREIEKTEPVKKLEYSPNHPLDELQSLPPLPKPDIVQLASLTGLGEAREAMQRALASASVATPQMPAQLKRGVEARSA